MNIQIQDIIDNLNHLIIIVRDGIAQWTFLGLDSKQQLTPKQMLHHFYVLMCQTCLYISYSESVGALRYFCSSHKYQSSSFYAYKIVFIGVKIQAVLPLQSFSTKGDKQFDALQIRSVSFLLRRHSCAFPRKGQ